jgi:hypothetical protein
VLQLLVFDVPSGTLQLNTSLPGLKTALGVSKDLPFMCVAGHGCLHTHAHTMNVQANTHAYTCMLHSLPAHTRRHTHCERTG